jgi:3-oxoacyl-[acyl-carrier protein] reductase
MTKRLQDKVALVTGGSRGIGRATVLQFAREGAKLIAIHYGNNSTAAEATAKEVEALGAKAILIQANLNEGKKAADSIWAQFKLLATEAAGSDKLDIVVNNAGIAPAGAMVDTSEDLFDEVMLVNFKAPFFIIQGAYAHLNDNGHVVNVSTGFTRIAAPSNPLYAASKGALDTLTLALAPDLASRGITINAVMPGVTETDMNKDWLADPASREFAANWSAFKRLGKPEDAAELITYLSSDASRWTTGQIIDVTGGTQI